MALIAEIFPAAAPIAGVTLATLADATTGAAIALPSVVAWTGPAAVTYPPGSASAGQPGQQWSCPFAAPASASVQWAAVVTNAGGSTSLLGPGVVAGDLVGPVVPAGVYATLGDMVGIFGAENIAAWSDLDNLKNPITIAARQQMAFNYADAELNNYFAGVLAVPIPTNPTLAYAGGGIAGVWMYSSRGQLDIVPGPFGDKVVNKYADMIRAIYADILNYRCGIKQFPAATFTASLAPVAVGGSPGGRSYERRYGCRW